MPGKNQTAQRIIEAGERGHDTKDSNHNTL
jgi:hypothetical protein